ncbi:MAG: hypothetical protein GY730_10485 [bacterium]|nr:hypothetical protein [bacterium]
MTISFGTSGHRGITGSDFTIKHVEAITLAISDYVLNINPDPSIAIGYDPRPGNSPRLEENSFTKETCDILLSRGINVHFFDFYVPTPLISWYIKEKGLDGGIILTASHNPPVYNGMKFNPANGAPAPSEVTKEIEISANNYFNQNNKPAAKMKGTLKKVNADNEFAKSIIEQCQKYCSFNNSDFSNLSVAIDAKHGTVSSVWDNLMNMLNIKYHILNKEPLTDFGGVEANPTKYSTLKDLRKKQKELSAQAAFANDPDGDRHVILDEDGKQLTPEETTVIIMDYFITKKTTLTGIATTVASSRLIKIAAQQNKLNFIETAVGFKYFADFLEKAKNNNQTALGVESSGGFTASFHTLEKCGYLPCILMLFIIKDTGKKISRLKEDILKKYGKTVFKEIEYRFLPDKKETLVKLFSSISQNTVNNSFTENLKAIVKTDGIKLVFDSNDWVLFRLSGTEPVARIYAESDNDKSAETLIQQAKIFLDNSVK